MITTSPYKNFRNAVWLSVAILINTSIAAAETDWSAAAAALNSAGVKSDDAAVIVQSAQLRKIPSDDVFAWAAVIAKAKQSGLPVTPMVDRVQQGLSKNIPSPKIESALNKLERDLAWGKTVLEANLKNDRTADKGLVEVTIANLEIARRQGFSERDVELLLNVKNMRMEQIADVAELVVEYGLRGVDRETVVTRLKQGIADGLRGDQLRQLSMESRREAKKEHRIERFTPQELEPIPLSGKVEIEKVDASERRGEQQHENETETHDVEKPESDEIAEKPEPIESPEAPEPPESPERPEGVEKIEPPEIQKPEIEQHQIEPLQSEPVEIHPVEIQPVEIH